MLIFPLPTSPQLVSFPLRGNQPLSFSLSQSLVTYYTGGTGHAADARSSYRQGYQVVDNYFVRVLAGKSAWDLPPGRVGNDELQVRFPSSLWWPSRLPQITNAVDH